MSTPAAARLALSGSADTSDQQAPLDGQAANQPPAMIPLRLPRNSATARS
jgi:hypothetical protein